jgi:hypothetical protein
LHGITCRLSKTLRQLSLNSSKIELPRAFLPKILISIPTITVLWYRRDSRQCSITLGPENQFLYGKREVLYVLKEKYLKDGEACPYSIIRTNSRDAVFVYRLLSLTDSPLPPRVALSIFTTNGLVGVPVWQG